MSIGKWISTLLGQARRVFFLAAFRGIDNTPTTGDAILGAGRAAREKATRDYQAEQARG